MAILPCKNTFTLIYSSDQTGNPEELVPAGSLTQRRKFRSSVITAGGILFFLVPSLPGQNTGFHHAPSSAAARKNPLAGQHAAVAAGETIYAGKCSKCHGDQGRGIGPVPSLAKGRAQKAKAGELFWFITRGDIDSGMPSWAKLSERQRWQVVTYIKSLGAPEKSRTQGRP
jgi:mono/diheme cytochrome c family protein